MNELDLIRRHFDHLSLFGVTLFCLVDWRELCSISSDDKEYDCLLDQIAWEKYEGQFAE